MRERQRCQAGEPLLAISLALYSCLLDSTLPVHTLQVLEERFPGTLLLPDVRELQELPEVRHTCKQDCNYVWLVQIECQGLKLKLPRVCTS